MSEQQSEQERFEAAMVAQAASEGYSCPDFVLEKNLNGRYATTWVYGAWIGWQARAALSKPSTKWTHEINQELERQYLKGFQAGKAFEREECAKAVESLEAKLPSLEDYEDTGAYLVWEVSQKHDDRWIEQPIAAAAIRSRKDAP